MIEITKDIEVMQFRNKSDILYLKNIYHSDKAICADELHYGFCASAQDSDNGFTEIRCILNAWNFGMKIIEVQYDNFSNNERNVKKWYEVFLMDDDGFYHINKESESSPFMVLAYLDDMISSLNSPQKRVVSMPDLIEEDFDIFTEEE